MNDWSLEASTILVSGRSGSGKTSFCFRYLANRLTEQPANDNPAAAVFIFDHEGKAARRLGIAPVGTVARLNEALARRLVIFDPRIMFQPREGLAPADRRAFAWFCAWVFEVAARGPGKKILFVDEMRTLVPGRSDQIPPSLEKIFREGRELNLELLTATQFPKDYPTPIRDAVTEWVAFNASEPDNLDAMRPYFPDVRRVAGLKLGEYIAVNRNSGAELAGKIF